MATGRSGASPEGSCRKASTEEIAATYNGSLSGPVLQIRRPDSQHSGRSLRASLIHLLRYDPKVPKHIVQGMVLFRLEPIWVPHPKMRREENQVVIVNARDGHYEPPAMNACHS